MLQIMEHLLKRSDLVLWGHQLYLCCFKLSVVRHKTFLRIKTYLISPDEEGADSDPTPNFWRIPPEPYPKVKVVQNTLIGSSVDLDATICLFAFSPIQIYKKNYYINDFFRGIAPFSTWVPFRSKQNFQVFFTYCEYLNDRK